MPFMIKQNDLRPYMTGQIMQSDNVTPLNLTAASSLKLILRKQEDGLQTPLFKKACTITNAAQGEWEYSWDLGDTAQAGAFNAELEILWGGTEPQTVPVDGYYTITIVDDLEDVQTN